MSHDQLVEAFRTAPASYHAAMLNAAGEPGTPRRAEALCALLEATDVRGRADPPPVVVDVHAARVFAPAVWAEILAAAEDADELDRQNPSRWFVDMGPDRNRIGKAAERLYGDLLGQPTDLHKVFDGGVDFGRTDVKGSKYYQEPLLRRLEKQPWHADWYALVAVDLQGCRARYVGWATRDELRTAPVKNWGWSDTRVLPESALHKGLAPS